MDETIIIVRHGERLDKEDKLWVHTSPAPWDPPLSPAGLETVAELSATLGKIDVSAPVRLYTSPFLRCVQTADAIARGFGVQMRLAAVFGEWMTPEYFEHGAPPEDGHHTIAASSKLSLLRTSAAQIDFGWPLDALGPAGGYGETWSEMHARAERGLDAALQGSGTTIIVSHGSVCNGMIAVLRRVPQMEIITQGGYVVIRR